LNTVGARRPVLRKKYHLASRKRTSEVFLRSSSRAMEDGLNALNERVQSGDKLPSCRP
jgi:hypothetical protein